MIKTMPNHVRAITEIVGAQFIAPLLVNRCAKMGAMMQGAMNRAPTVGDVMPVVLEKDFA